MLYVKERASCTNISDTNATGPVGTYRSNGTMVEDKSNTCSITEQVPHVLEKLKNENGFWYRELHTDPRYAELINKIESFCNEVSS